MSNEVAALGGGQADAGLIPAALANASVQRGDMKLLGWMGDEAHWQLSVIVTSTKNAQNRVDPLRRSIPYVDADLRLDVADVLRQIAWYKSQGMVKREVAGDGIIDKRYVVRLTTE